MARDNSNNVLWFVAGAAVGATVALLYAPQTGERTRRLISKKIKEGREAAADTASDLLEKSRDLYDKGRRVADDAADLFERGRDLVRG